MLLDPVAADFPDLQIIMAHPSVPWQDEALSVATHKSQHLDRPVGLEPEVLPGRARALRRTRYLKSRVLFGSDFPMLTPDRWIDDADEDRASSPR